ncbi:hypothetical protein FOL47_003072 [Perkinsus chesapeaki]|uniref:Acylphosphatase-like domain-containing protein n=1 Tax=Perkinsus chesapeaki TaxID=330153 RepID=A0A7J6MAF3_PERCH|nr:hypothetical protein FOL47_003072 [Perkinsus chesapeaki]
MLRWSRIRFVHNYAKTKVDEQLAITRRPCPDYKPGKNLLSYPMERCKTVKGIPFYGKRYDPYMKPPTSNRRYRKPEPRPQIKTDYTEDDMHEMLGKYRFEITGKFPPDEFGFTAAPFEKEIWKVADDLFLKGWIRVREKFAQGELGGDVNALSYFRKWVEQQHNKSGVIHTSHFFDDNYGITKLPAPVLKCIKDMRPYRKKRLHMGKKLIRKDLSRYEAYSKAEELRREKLVDEALVQDY